MAGYVFDENGVKRIVDAVRYHEGGLRGGHVTYRRQNAGSSGDTILHYRLTSTLYRTKTNATGIEIYWDGDSWEDVDGSTVTVRGDQFKGYSWTADRITAFGMADDVIAFGSGTHLVQGTINGTTVTLTGSSKTVTVLNNLGVVDNGSLVWAGWDEQQQLWDVVSAQCAVPGQLQFNQTYNSGQIGLL